MVVAVLTQVVVAVLTKRMNKKAVAVLTHSVVAVLAMSRRTRWLLLRCK